MWIVHGTQILRCAPEQLQPVTRDLKGLDMEINGPFLPHDLMKGKKFYHDLLEEQRDMEHDLIEGDTNAWHQDPNNLRLEHPDQPEIKRRKLQGKQTVSKQELDSVRTGHERAAGSRRGGDHDVQRSCSKRDRAGGDDLGRTQEVDLTKRQALREAVRESVDRGHELRQVDSSPLEERRSMEALGGRRLGRSLGPWLYRRDELQEQDPDGPNDGDVQPNVPSHGAPRDGDHPSDPAHGEDREVREPWTERSRTPPPRHLSDRVLFVEPKYDEIEMVLDVQSREVHLQKRGKLGCWVVNSDAKRGAEVVFRNLSEEEKTQFKQAKRKEIDSYIENMAIEIAKSQGIDESRILGMRWILTWKTVNDENGNKVGRKPKARLIVKGFQDPDLLRIPRDAPTLSTLGRNMVLSVGAMNGWEMFLGDIKTAFLNSDPTELERQIYGNTQRDVKEELGMHPKDVFRICKAVYGLLNAPRKWLEKLSKELKGLGWKQSSLYR